MRRVKYFIPMLIAAVLAIIALVTGVLFLTALKPADTVHPKVSPSQPYVMTRNGVLARSGNTVITATVPEGQPVSLVVGFTPDIIDWIGTNAYTEVVGIERGWQKLKVEDHSARPNSDKTAHESTSSPTSTTQSASPQSGDKINSVVPSSHMPVTEAQSGVAADADPAQSDMWHQKVTGTGTVSLTVESKNGAGRSVLAVAPGSDKAPDLAFSLTSKGSNYQAIVAFVIAGILAVVTMILLGTAIAKSRRAVSGVEKINDKGKNDVVDVDATEVLSPISLKNDPPTDTSDFDVDALAKQDHVEVHPAHGDVNKSSRSAHPSHRSGDSKIRSFDTKDLLEFDSLPKDQEPHAASPSRHSGTQIQNSGEKSHRTRFAPPALHSDGSSHTPNTDDDNVDHATVFPSRRELREARHRGEKVLIVGDKEFDTGLIPVVKTELKNAQGQNSAEIKEASPQGTGVKNTNISDTMTFSRGQQTAGETGEESSEKPSWEETAKKYLQNNDSEEHK